LNILHITPYYKPAWSFGGPPKAIADIAEDQAAKGHSVKVVSLNWDGHKPLFAKTQPVFMKMNRVETHFLPTNRLLPGFHFFSPWLSKYLDRFSKTDLVHIHMLFNHFSTVGFRWVEKLRIPYVVSPHGMLIPEALKRSWLKKKWHFQWIEKHLLKGASGLHFTTEDERRHSGYNGDKRSAVIPLGLHFSGKKRRIDRSTGKLLRMIFVGRLHPIKGLEDFIRGLLLLRSQREWRFEIWGPDELRHRAELESLVVQSGLTDRVIFKGILESDSKDRVLNGSSLLVLPSRQENFGMSAAEAMAARVPVLLSEAVGLAPFVQKNHSGWVSERKPEAFAIALEKIMKLSPVLLTRTGRNGAAAVRKAFDIKITGRKMISFYERCQR